MYIAVPFFFELGSFAAQENTTLCIEANPKVYGCDFITNTEEAISLVQKVNHPGFQLHLDAGAMELNNEDVYSTIEKAMPYLKHFHISEPYLNLVGTGQTKHKEMAGVLRTLGYKNWVSIEMKSGLSSSNIQSVEKALAFALKTYV
ncbi:Xylose isomerase-like TIM barrel [compost metagenome]